ncbi:hypothetical protein HK102_003337 [Quaeritorhiza haematococci]|nr:hypothetical protein HK102_003337 [Quaeritorhiza haematococci]
MPSSSTFAHDRRRWHSHVSHSFFRSALLVLILLQTTLADIEESFSSSTASKALWSSFTSDVKIGAQIPAHSAPYAMQFPAPLSMSTRAAETTDLIVTSSSAPSDGTLEFYFQHKQAVDTFLTTSWFRVEASGDGGQTWTTIKELAGNVDFGPVRTPFGELKWGLVSVPVKYSGSKVRFRFSCNGQAYHDFAIDDLKIVGVSLPPTIDGGSSSPSSGSTPSSTGGTSSPGSGTSPQNPNDSSTTSSTQSNASNNSNYTEAAILKIVIPVAGTVLVAFLGGYIRYVWKRKQVKLQQESQSGPPTGNRGLSAV